MQQPLSPQQVHALRALRAAGSITTESFRATVRTLDGHPYTDDQARNLLKRLEKRGHLAGDGQGRTRVWTYVPTEELQLALGPDQEPAPGGRAARDPETAIRTYVVLERRDLAELVREILDEAGVEALTDAQEDALDQVEAVFARLADPEARNTEHALRSAAKGAYSDVPGDHAPQLVAVASRHFQIETVAVRNAQTVSIGSRR